MRPARKVLFSVILCGLGLGVLEVAARLLEWVHPEPTRTMPLPFAGQDSPEFTRKAELVRRTMGTGATPLVEDPDLGWTLPRHAVFRPGPVQVQTNTWGLRGPEIEPVPAGGVRLLTLGDSSVYGESVNEPDIFSVVASEILEDHWKMDVQAVNGAVPGYDSGQCLRQLERLGPALTPRLVVIGAIWSDIHLQMRQAQAGRTTLTLRHVAVYRLLRQVLEPFLVPVRVGFIRNRQEIGAPSGPSTGRVSLPSYLANLRAMARKAAEIQAEPVFLLLPAPLDLEEAPLPESVALYREAMRQVAAEGDWGLVDGPAYFRARGATFAYFEDQVHPSTPGHHLLGAALASALLERHPDGVPPAPAGEPR